MKNIPSFLTSILLYLCIYSTHGEKTNLPNSLVLGYQLYDQLITTDRCIVVIIVQSENETGGLNTCGSCSAGIQFKSYYEYQKHVAVNGLRLFNMLGGQKQSSNIRFRVSMMREMNVDESNLATDTLINSDINVGNAKDLSFDSFFITTDLGKVEYKLNNLQFANVLLGTNENTTLSISSNGFLINELLATNINRMRIILTESNGTTATYTQYGNQILPPEVSIIWIPRQPNGSYNSDFYENDFYMTEEWKWYNQYWRYFELCYNDMQPEVNSHNLIVSSSRGADTTVEGTTDFVTWTVINKSTWDSYQCGTEMLLVTPLKDTRMFFRAYSY